MKRTLFILMALVFMSTTALAGDLQDGRDAYDRGDYSTAISKFTKLAEQGDALAQSDLGYMYANGDGVPKDYKRAVYWFSKAAEQEEAWAQYNLGVMYREGKGVPEDSVMAYMWWNLAAAQGIEEARNNLEFLEDWVGMAPEQIAEAQRLSREWRPAAEGGQDHNASERTQSKPTVAKPKSSNDVPVNDHLARIQEKVRSRIVIPPNLSGNPECAYQVTVLPEGDVLEATLIKSSGVPEYDHAVHRAIMAAQPLPVPRESDLFQAYFRKFVLRFRLKE